MKDHIGKKIKVTIGIFASTLASSLMEEVREGVLTGYEGGYCNWEINGIAQPIIHSSSVEVIEI